MLCRDAEIVFFLRWFVALEWTRGSMFQAEHEGVLNVQFSIAVQQKICDETLEDSRMST